MRVPCQILSYFWVFWCKIHLSSGHKVRWFRVGWKILLELIFPHVGLSSMLFWAQSEDPPTFMICGFKKEHMLNYILYLILPLWFLISLTPEISKEENHFLKILFWNTIYKKYISSFANWLNRVNIFYMLYCVLRRILNIFYILCFYFWQ